jgi:hypothetical protein
MSTEPNSNILRIPQFVAAHPQFTADSIRWQIHNADNNGLAKSGAIIRLKSRPDAKRGALYLDVDRYFQWMRSQASA